MKMTIIPLSLLFSLSLTLTLTYTTNAFDITQILNQYPEFSTFNSYLTQTNLAAEINARQTITVLVVDNAHAAPLSAKPLDLIKNILAVHVILDYFDAPKLQQFSASSALITTLFQATGLARGQQGFLNVTHAASGSIAFASAMPGSPLDSNLVKSVVLQPYNISVLQVSTAIIPQGIDGSKTSSPPVKAPVATATPPPPPLPPSSVTPASPVTPATSTPVSSQTPPPTPATRAIPVLVPSTAPPKPSVAPIPSTAPPTTSSASVPSAAPPKPSTASVPSTAPPTSSKAAPVPSSIPPTVGGPAPATTPSATPASTPEVSAPGPALGPASEAPTSEEPGTTPPAAGKPKGKSAGTTLDVGLAVVFTMVLSTFYLTSTI